MKNEGGRNRSRRWEAAKDALLGAWLSVRHRSALERFVRGADYAQNAVDIFQGEWVTSFPPPWTVRAGSKPLYDDGRLRWMDEHLPVRGRTWIELGPMEAGHTRQLLSLGAASVTAVESNQRAFLKCLVVKELLDLGKARFVCADFVEYLEENPATYDACLASGVLYHMREPLRLLELVARQAQAVCLWTHYYDPKRIRANAQQAHRFGPMAELEHNGFRTTGVRRAYGAQVWNPLHLGGNASYSYWLTRDGILGALAHYGCREMVIGQEQPDHPAGPAFAVVARK